MGYVSGFNTNYNKERIDMEYFIDRLGKVHKYKGAIEVEIISMHAEIMAALFPEINNAEDYAMKLGWILVGSTCYSHPIIKKKPTQSQINTLFKLNEYDRLHFEHEGYYVNYEKYSLLQK